MRSGEPIPSWITIREVIGKGSPHDIRKGVADFQLEHAEKLRKMGSLPGVPEHLAPLVQSLWESALAEAHAQFESQVGEWMQKIDDANNQRQEAESQLAEAKTTIQIQRNEAETLLLKISALEDNLLTEQTARQQAERLFEKHLAEMTEQRNKLEKTLMDNQAEMQKMLGRFEGERKHTMMEIEAARANAAKEIASIRRQAGQEKSTLEIDVAKHLNAIANVQNQLKEVEQQVAVLTEKLRNMTDRAKKAEAHADELEKHAKYLDGELQSSRVHVQAQQCALDAAAREIDSAKAAAKEARAEAKHAVEDAAELRGKMQGLRP